MVPVPALKDGVCFADADKQKWSAPFLGLPVMHITQALERFPDADIYVSLAFPAKYSVLGYLTEELHIPKERILNYEPVEKYASCEYLQGYLLIKNDGLGFCFNNFGRNLPPNIPSGADNESALQNFSAVRDRLIDGIRSGAQDNPCAGCRDVRVRYWPKQCHIKHLYVDDYSGCNIHCCYCTVSKPLSSAKKPPAEFDYVSFIHYLESTGQTEEDFRCDVLPGEITVHPRCEEILQAVRPYPNVFFSNAIVFNHTIAEILDRGLSYIYVSMDAGTPETFAKIKGIDAFKQVCGNLKEYSRHGPIELKYIVLPGINDTQADAKGFVELCKDVNAQNVMLSRNYHGWAEIDDHQLAFTVDLYSSLIEARVLVSIPAWQYSAAENQRIQKAVEEKGYQRF